MEAAPLSSPIAEAPEGGAAYWVTARDGVRLRVGAWQSTQSKRGTIFILPGRTEYIEKYGRTITQLSHLGFSTVVMDWRGQGIADRLMPDRMLGHVEDFQDYQHDVAALEQAALALHMPKPWFILGNSMGACIALRALQNGFPAQACLFTSPMWDIKLAPLSRWAVRPLAWITKAIGKKNIYAPTTDNQSYVLKTPFANNRLTQDPDMYAYYTRQTTALPDHQLGGLSLRWLAAALQETRDLMNCPAPNVACTTICGSLDELIEYPTVQEYMTRWPNGRFRLIEHARHDLLCETRPIREAVFDHIAKTFVPNAP